MGFLDKLFGHKNFNNAFLITGILLQTLLCLLLQDSLLSYTCAVSGIICVILCAQKKILQFLFSFIQLVIYGWLSYKAKLYGEVAMQGFYLVTMAWGIILWKRQSHAGKITASKLPLAYNMCIWVLSGIACIVLYKILVMSDDPEPLADSITTITAVAAQCLMMLCYRENWIFWFVLNITSVIMWGMLGNWILAAQFIFWSFNAVYGYWSWNPKNNQ